MHVYERGRRFYKEKAEWRHTLGLQDPKQDVNNIQNVPRKMYVT
jgi:hypothetical protein